MSTTKREHVTGIEKISWLVTKRKPGVGPKSSGELERMRQIVSLHRMP